MNPAGGVRVLCNMGKINRTGKQTIEEKRRGTWTEEARSTVDVQRLAALMHGASYAF
jgi:hypothetical protein